MTEFEFLDSEDKQLIAKYLSKLDFVLSVNYVSKYIVYVRVDAVDGEDVCCDVIRAVGKVLKDRYCFSPFLEFVPVVKNQKCLNGESLFTRGKITTNFDDYKVVPCNCIPKNTLIFSSGENTVGITNIDV